MAWSTVEDKASKMTENWSVCHLAWQHVDTGNINKGDFLEFIGKEIRLEQTSKKLSDEMLVGCPNITENNCK